MTRAAGLPIAAATGLIIALKNMNGNVTNNRRDEGLTLSSFLVSLLLLAMLSLSLAHYYNNLIVWFFKQQILIEGERLAFAQLDIYPSLMTFDAENWFRKIDYHMIDADCYCLTVIFEHKNGYRSHQERIRCVKGNGDKE